MPPIVFIVSKKKCMNYLLKHFYGITLPRSLGDGKSEELDSITDVDCIRTSRGKGFAFCVESNELELKYCRHLYSPYPKLFFSQDFFQSIFIKLPV